MATLTVWKFEESDGAERTLGTLAGLQKQELIDVQDAAIVSWETGKKRPKTRQAVNLAGLGALDGAFWGMLFGLIFFVPLFGAAVGAAFGALGGAMGDVGIDDDFIDSVRSQVTEGTSALFLLSDNAVTERVHDALEGTHMELIASNLTSEQQTKLAEIFA